MSDQKHLTLEGRIIIEKGLDSRLSFKAIARAVNKDCTTISKEVRGHLSFEKTGSYGRAFNDCLHLLFLRKVHTPVSRLRKRGLQPPSKTSLCLQRLCGPDQMHS